MIVSVPLRVFVTHECKCFFFLPSFLGKNTEKAFYTLKTTNNSWCKMTQIVQVKVYQVSEGTVMVYKVVNDSEEFYDVVFNDGVKGQVWGLGKTVDKALKNAIRAWSEGHRDMEYNPFKEALDKEREGRKC